MKRSFLEKLQRTALLALIGTLCLLLIVPALQLLVLGPQGYVSALATLLASLVWIQGHTALFLLYRLALLLGFALLLGLPFALFRIIVAQEIIGRAELAEDEKEEDSEDEDAEEGEEEQEELVDKASTNGLPAFAWRGKGFAVIAAWSGLVGLALLVLGTLGSTIYFWSRASQLPLPGLEMPPLPDNFATISGVFAILTYTVGGGLLGLACIFFGIAIARSGRRLWPDSWVAFAYAGLAIGAVSSGSAVQVVLAPTGGQATLTTPAILLIALWSLWFGIMVIRLKPE